MYLSVFYLVTPDDTDENVSKTINSLRKLLDKFDTCEVIVVDVKRETNKSWFDIALDLNIAQKQVRKIINEFKNFENVSYVYEDYFKSDLVQGFGGLSNGKYCMLVHSGAEFEINEFENIVSFDGYDCIVTGLTKNIKNHFTANSTKSELRFVEFKAINNYFLSNDATALTSITNSALLPTENIIFSKKLFEKKYGFLNGFEGYGCIQKLFFSSALSGANVKVTDKIFVSGGEFAYLNNLRYIQNERERYFDLINIDNKTSEILFIISKAMANAIDYKYLEIKCGEYTQKIKSSLNKVVSDCELFCENVVEFISRNSLRFHLNGFLSATECISKGSKSTKVSLITSLFNGLDLLPSLCSNIYSQDDKDLIEWIVVDPQRMSCIKAFLEIVGKNPGFPTLQHLELDSDPGLYECWNIGIKASKSQFVGNLNIDDRKFAWHTTKLISLLGENPNCVAASTGCVATNDVQSIVSLDPFADFNSVVGELWFCEDWNAYSNIRQKNDFVKLDNERSIEYTYNFLHCMPIWKKEIHDKYGFFDEEKYGTYADFAFWLIVTSHNENVVHLMRPGYVYLIDLNSHNRKHEKKNLLGKILKDHFPNFSLNHFLQAPVVNDEFSDSQYTHKPSSNRPFYIGNQSQSNFGFHRSGWSYVVKQLESINSTNGIALETFVEKKFSWGTESGEASSDNPVPYNVPWVGFIHVPPFVPRWFQYNQSNNQIFQTDLFLKSLPYCKGLFCLSEHHRKSLIKLFDFPISVVYHPTEIPERKFDFDSFIKNEDKRLIQIGWWLRKLNAIYFVRTALKRTILGKNDYMKSMLMINERCVNGMVFEECNLQVELIDYLNNDSYDDIMSKNIVFVDFYDTSANNLVIECIARCTPLVVRRHPAVVEYLGKDYPLYYDDYDMIFELTSDFLRIKAASEYLKDSEVQNKISSKSFIDSLLSSEVVARLRTDGLIH